MRHLAKSITFLFVTSMFPIDDDTKRTGILISSVNCVALGKAIAVSPQVKGVIA